MGNIGTFRLCGLFVFFWAAQAYILPSAAEEAWSIQSKTGVAGGWHPWYQLQADPEDDDSLIVCGMELNSEQNEMHIVVYHSSDGGRNWVLTMTDWHSAWVSEPSCAYGPHHRAYLISEASLFEGGQMHHFLGTTRLFFSIDSGRTWTETAKTGWADYSSSAVSRKNERLYTFYHMPGYRSTGEHNGNVGLLVFSPDGKSLSGPFTSREIQTEGYESVYPSGAIGLNDGSVVALFNGIKGWRDGKAVEDLGLERIEPSSEQEPRIVKIASCDARESSCLPLAQYSLAYDRDQNRLYLAYISKSGGKRDLLLTSSNDGGRTWSDGAALRHSPSEDSDFESPSLAVGPGGVLGLLWQDEKLTGRWRFSTIREGALVEPGVELSPALKQVFIGNDSLMTTLGPSAKSGISKIMVNLRSEWNRVGGSSGLQGTSRALRAVWLGGDESGTELKAAVLIPEQKPTTSSANQSGKTTSLYFEGLRDVTRETLLLYDGRQRYDRATQTLSLDLRLNNRSSAPLKGPIKLAIDELTSSFGAVKLVNAHEQTGPGSLLLDITSVLTGRQIAAGGSSNTISLTFLLQPSGEEIRVDGENLLQMAVRVYASR
jgi:hypothetical protein